MGALLPTIDFYDRIFENNGWSWTDGICGLVPSRSNVKDAEQLWGCATGVSELANGFTYSFLNGAVRVTVLHDHSTISKIVLRNQPETVEFMPPNIMAAISRFGSLSATRVDRFDGVTFERPGMRVICDPARDPEEVLSIEVFRPCQE